MITEITVARPMPGHPRGEQGRPDQLFRQLYSEVAVDNYMRVAKEFDAAADEFNTSAWQMRRGGLGGRHRLGCPATRSGAFSVVDCAKHAAGLDRLVPVLQL